MKKDFKVLLESAQEQKTEDCEELLLRYKPLLLKEAVIDGVFDEDLYQEYCMVFIVVFENFQHKKAIPMNETLTVDIILLGAYTIYDRNLIYQCKSLDKSRKIGYNINAR